MILRKEKNIFSFFSQNEGSLIHSSLKDLFKMAGRGSRYPDVAEKALPSNLLGSDLVDGSGGFAANFIAKARFQGSASVKKSQTMLFSYKNARELSVNFIILDEYMQSSKLNAGSLTFREAVQKGNIYIITSALVSKELELKNAGEFNFTGNLTAEVVAESMNGSASANYANTEKYLINSNGNIPLTFAIKAVRILYDDDKFRIKPEKIQVRGANDEMEYMEDEEAIILI